MTKNFKSPKIEIWQNFLLVLKLFLCFTAYIMFLNFPTNLSKELIKFDLNNLKTPYNKVSSPFRVKILSLKFTEYSNKRLYRQLRYSRENTDVRPHRLYKRLLQPARGSWIWVYWALKATKNLNKIQPIVILLILNFAEAWIPPIT